MCTRNGTNWEISRSANRWGFSAEIKKISRRYTGSPTNRSKRKNCSNSMNDSGEFQEVESNYSGRLSHVSSQPAMIPSSHASLSRDKRLRLDTWSQFGLQENVIWKSIFYVWFTQSFLIKEFNPTTCMETEKQSLKQEGRRVVTQVKTDRQNQGTVAMPTFAPRPLTTSSTILVEFLQNCMVGQQWQQVLEVQFDKFPTSSSYVGR